MGANMSSFGKTRQLTVADFAIAIEDIDFLSAELKGKGLVWSELGDRWFYFFFGNR